MGCQHTQCVYALQFDRCLLHFSIQATKRSVHSNINGAWRHMHMHMLLLLLLLLLTLSCVVLMAAWISSTGRLLRQDDSSAPAVTGNTPFAAVAAAAAAAAAD